MGMSDRLKPGKSRFDSCGFRCGRCEETGYFGTVFGSIEPRHTCLARVLCPLDRGRGVAATSLASNQVSWVQSPPSARVRRCEEEGYFD